MAKNTSVSCAWLMVVVVVLALIVRPAKASFDCSNAKIELLACIGFLLNFQPQPSQECCSGVQDVANDANSSTESLKDACDCLKSAAPGFPSINFDNARKLPALCNVNLNITIDPNLDCNSLI